KPPLVAATASHSTCRGRRVTGVPSNFISRAAVAVTSASSPSSSTIARRVCSRIAGISEATKFSPSPSPSTSGVAVLAATSLSGSVSDSTTIENEPRSRKTASRTASVSPRPPLSFSSITCEISSVSVSERSLCPCASSSARSSMKFSTMPLWMTATGPALCGCALSSDGRPCVAHRVCPIPMWPCMGESASRWRRFSSLPFARRISSLLSTKVAMPAESYPRYSRRPSPSSRMGEASRGPTYPIIPHMIVRSFPRIRGEVCRVIRTHRLRAKRLRYDLCRRVWEITSEPDALPLEAYFVARSLARFARLYRLWSREAIRRIFRYCFHLVNSWPDAAMSPGATLALCFLSLRPSPRCGDYSRWGELVQAMRLVLMILAALQAAVGAVAVPLAPGRHPARLFALRMMRHHERAVGHLANNGRPRRDEHVAADLDRRDQLRVA